MASQKSKIIFTWGESGVDSWALEVTLVTGFSSLVTGVISVFFVGFGVSTVNKE